MKLIILLFILFNLLGCATPKIESWSIALLYNEATEAMNDGDFERAIKYYEILEARYPAGKYVQQAQMNVIYAYFKNEDSDSAIIAANRFIKLSPRHSKVDYVYYIKGLVYFEQNRGSLDRFLALDRSQRDQRGLTQSIQAFEELIERFPKSKYSPDAQKRMIYLRNIQAQHEIHVALFYLKRGAYIASANRAKKVIASYQKSHLVSKALVILAKNYKIMGLHALSHRTLEILQSKYPNHPGIAEVTALKVK